MTVAQLADPSKVLGGRHDIAAFALDRLGKERCHLVCRADGGKHHILDVADAVQVARGVGQVKGAAIAVGVRDVRGSGHERGKAAPLYGLGAGERERAHGPPMKSAQVGDAARAPAMVACHLERRLDALGARVGEKGPRLLGDGGQGVEPFGQLHLRRIVKVGPGHVEEAARLILDGLDDVRVAVAGRAHGDPSAHVEETVAIYVPHLGASAMVHDKGVGTGGGGGELCPVALDPRPAVGSGQVQSRH